RFGFTEVRLGLIPAVISPYCIAKIGVSHARAWFMSGEQFDANQAKLMGLVHDICDDENFENKFEQIINSFLKAAPLAASLAKELINEVIKLDKADVEQYTC